MPPPHTHLLRSGLAAALIAAGGWLSSAHAADVEACDLLPTADAPLPCALFASEPHVDGPFRFLNLGRAYFDDSGELSAAAVDELNAVCERRAPNPTLGRDDATVGFADTVVVTSEGEIWIVEEVDWSAYDARVSDYDIASGQPGAVYDPSMWPMDLEPDEESGANVFQSWFSGWCTNWTPSVFFAYWNGDSRNPVTSSSSPCGSRPRSC